MKFSFERVTNALFGDFRNKVNQLMADVENNFKETTSNTYKAQTDASQALEDSTEALQKSKNTQAQVDALVVGSNTSPAETVQARVDKDGNTFTTLKQRIDSDTGKINAQLEDISYLVTDGTNLQSLIDSVPKNSKIKFSKNITNGQFPITTEITINKALAIDFNKIELVQKTSGKGGLKITSSGVRIENLILTGYQNASVVGAEIAINCFGIDSSNYIKGLVIENCEIKNFGFSGVRMQFVTDFVIQRNSIHDVTQSGVITYSCKDGDISYNSIKDIKNTTSRSYGIVATRTEHDSLVTHPRSENIKVHKNKIENVLSWEGLDTHGGKSITFTENEIINCSQGIVLTPSDNGSQVQTFAPINCLVAFNKIISTNENGTNGYGLAVAGCDTNTERALDCTVIGNTIKNYGAESSSSSGGMYIRHTENLMITENKIINPSPNGIYMISNNINFTIVKNTIIDVWTTNSTQAVGVLLYLAPQNGIVSGNTFKKNGKTATIVLNRAVRISPSSGILIELSNNYSDADTYLTETANTYQSYRQTATGRIFSGTAIPTSGTWKSGDFIDNSNKSLLGTSPSRYILMGYICRSAGSPGAWNECRNPIE